MPNIKCKVSVVLNGKEVKIPVCTYSSLWDANAVASMMADFKEMIDSDESGQLVAETMKAIGAGPVNGDKLIGDKNYIKCLINVDDLKPLEIRMFMGYGEDVIKNNYLKIINCIRFGIANPYMTFVRSVKGGLCNDLSDEDYARKLEDMKTVSAIWGDSPTVGFVEFILLSATIVMIEGKDSKHLYKINIDERNS